LDVCECNDKDENSLISAPPPSPPPPSDVLSGACATRSSLLVFGHQSVTDLQNVDLRSIVLPELVEGDAAIKGGLQSSGARGVKTEDMISSCHRLVKGKVSKCQAA
jgi:hypothetical protein